MPPHSLKYLAFRGTSCFCYKTIALLHFFQTSFPPGFHPFNTVPDTALFRLREQNDDQQLDADMMVWEQNEQSLPYYRKEGGRNGSGIGVMFTTDEVCYPTLQLESLRGNDCKAFLRTDGGREEKHLSVTHGIRD